MSFLWRSDKISEGDVVIVRRDNILESLTIVRNAEYQLTAGLYRHNDMIGKPWGCKMYSHNRKQIITLLAPTPELWTLSLPHRTQILYAPDIAMVTLLLELRQGSVVVECGTGSGSLTHALARAVGNKGHVHTHEFHEMRYKVAVEEFQSHGLNNVSCYHRNVCLDGFNVADVADAVFLDLPSPWDAVGHAVKAMRHEGGRFCSFSPCIEQIQKTCVELAKHGFDEIQTFECLERQYQLSRKRVHQPYIGNERHKKFRLEQQQDTNNDAWQQVFIKSGAKKVAIGHTGYLIFASLPPKLRDLHETKSEERKENSVDNNVEPINETVSHTQSDNRLEENVDNDNITSESIE